MSTNKLSTSRLIGEHANSIVNKAIRTILSLFIFFFEKILSLKKSPKRKINNFPPLRGFSAQKSVAFIVFCLIVFILLVSFCLICIFLHLNLFVKKKKQTKYCPDSLIYNATFKIVSC